MELPIEEIKMLASIERKFDSGEMKYVLLNGGKVAVTDEALKELGLVEKQAISLTILRSILQFNIADCSAQMAINKAQSN